MSSAKLRSLRLCLGVAFAAVLLWSVHAPPLLAVDPPFRVEAHLNSDCYTDTLLCTKRSGDAQMYLPEVIFWGVADSTSPCPVDTTLPTPVAFTHFIYAPHQTDGSVSLMRLNPHDTIADIVLHLWWKKDSTSTEPDTSRSIVIFGQDRISTMATIFVDQISSTSQTVPFVAQALRRGIELTEEQVRDLSGIKSHVIRAIDVVVKDSTQPPPHPVVASVEDNAIMRVYPNPTVFTATIEAELSAGTYTAKVVNITGRVLSEQAVVMAEAGPLWREVDVSDLPNGYYVVQLVRQGRIVGAYPFTILR